MSLGKFKILFFIILFISYNLVAQNEIDSLKNILSASREKDKPEILNSLSLAYRQTDPGQSLEYANQALELSKIIEDPKQEIEAYRNIGKAFQLQNKFNKALEYIQYEMEEKKLTGDTLNIYSTYNLLGLLYFKLDKYGKSLEYHDLALELVEIENKPRIISYTFTNIGNVYKQLGYYEKALVYHTAALKERENIDDKSLIAHSLNNIGNVYHRMRNFEEANRYYQESLQLKEEMEIFAGIPLTLFNIGHLNEQNKDYEKALEMYFAAYDKAEKLSNQLVLARISIHVGNIYNQQLRSQDALKYLQEGLSIAKQIRQKPLIRDGYKYLAELYSNKGDYRKSLEFSQLYSEVNDSIFNEKSNIQFAEIVSYIENKRQQRENEILRQLSENQSLQIIKQKNQNKTYFLIIIIIFFAALTLFYQYRIKNKANKILFRKNELINKQKEELIEANTTKDTIFSIIGHDLRGPIGNLQSLLEILTNKFNTLDKKNIEKYLRLSQNSASSTFNLLENLLYWANYQRGKMAFEPENFVLNEIIKTNINLLLGISRTKSLQISSDVDDSLTVFADRNMVSTVFRNLLSNAIKFTGESGKINISAQNINSSNVEISVSDTGIGIEEEDLTKIFNQRETKTKPGTNNEVGLGIGLLLSKDFVVKNGGKISVESKAGKGSTFKFTLPHKPA